jgi:ABC-type branched-subunit amino acid transport system ATPase component
VAVVIASDLAKDMAGEPLLRGVSFKLERRDRLTIAGRNGAGKTTLLRILAGLLRPHAGTARNTAAGWTVKGIVDMGEMGRTENGLLTMPSGYKAAWFKDSEGNILAVAYYKR